MSSKMIENKSWTIYELLEKIRNHEITKPKYQRKKKWCLLPNNKKDNVPNSKDYIDFLFKNHNSVHAISIADDNEGKYSNIDGNNRLYSLASFDKTPFEIYPEYLEEVITIIINEIKNVDIQNKIKSIFCSMSYSDIIHFKFHKYFIEKGETELYNNHLKNLRDNFEEPIERIHEKLKVIGKFEFDKHVKININLFTGYTTEELSEVFGDINKYNQSLSEIDLLASRLYNINSFVINDMVLVAAIKEELRKYYDEKSKDEVLDCFQFETNDSINAYDFMVGYQNLQHGKCNLIENVNDEGSTLFFKIYKTIYKGELEATFTTENINNFIEKIEKSTEILKNICEDWGVKTLDEGIFNISYKNIQLKKNLLYTIFCAIIGYININENINTIKKSIQKCIFFHFFVQDISDKDERKQQNINSEIRYEAGVAFVENQAQRFIKFPHAISAKITKEVVTNVLNILISDNIKPVERYLQNGNLPKNKRRGHKYFEKLLMLYYFKSKVPTDMLKCKFWVEHIAVFSSSWKNTLDIDRLGNVIPIVAEINQKRSNKHIKEYKRIDTIGFMQYITPFYISNADFNGKKIQKGIKSIVGISPTMVLLFPLPFYRKW